MDGDRGIRGVRDQSFNCIHYLPQVRYQHNQIFVFNRSPYYTKACDLAFARVRMIGDTLFTLFVFTIR